LLSLQTEDKFLATLFSDTRLFENQGPHALPIPLMRLQGALFKVVLSYSKDEGKRFRQQWHLFIREDLDES
jgi:hypothetical protein